MYYGINPSRWVTRLACSYGKIAENLLSGMPSNDAELVKALAERFEAFDTALGRPECYLESPGVHPSLVRIQRTILGSLKKFREPLSGVSQIDLQKQAFDRYEANNLRAKENHIPWPYKDTMRKIIARLLAEYDLCDKDPKFGPGAVGEGLSTTARWCRLFDASQTFDPINPEVVTGEYIGPIMKHDPTQLDCARLHAVPKDWNKLRLITVEPYANSYLQAWCRERMREVISLPGKPACFRAMCCSNSREEGQERHRRLTLEASRTGLLATLDLSDASDLVSYAQVSEVFPIDVMADLDRSRTSRYYRPDNGARGEIHMFAGMGNGTTFTVESIMFYAASRAIAQHAGLATSMVSVYGDDIICSTALAPILIREFARFGWTINVSKSYYDPDSRFRESCGIQAFNGQDVTLLRYRGGFNGPCGRVAVCELVNRCVHTPAFQPVVRYRWPELAEIPNLKCDPYTVGIASTGELPTLEEWAAAVTLRRKVENFRLDDNPPVGGFTAVPWWNYTEPDSRINGSYQRREIRLPRLTVPTESFTSGPKGLIYACLSGMLRGHTACAEVEREIPLELLLECSKDPTIPWPFKARKSTPIRIPAKDRERMAYRWTTGSTDWPASLPLRDPSAV